MVELRRKKLIFIRKRLKISKDNRKNYKNSNSQNFLEDNKIEAEICRIYQQKTRKEKTF